VQINPLNSNHVAQVQQNSVKESVAPSTLTTSGSVAENDPFKPSRIAKVFLSLTQELTDKERSDREAVLQQTLKKDYVATDLDLSIAPQKTPTNEEDSDYIASLTTPTELKGFLNDFYTLYNSGYTPVDLQI